LTDPVYSGIYHDKQAHEPDLDAVIKRAVAAGVQKFMVTGSDLEESKKAVELARRYCEFGRAAHRVYSNLFQWFC